MKKIALLSVLLLCSLAFGVISDESWGKLSKYYFLNKTNTSDATLKYNLAMTYAYTGYIEDGFREIAAIPSMDSTFKERVVDIYSKKTKAHPENWEYHFYYAFALYVNDKKDIAIEEFKKVVSLTTEDSIKGWAYGYIAYIYGERKVWDKAMDNITTAIKYEPDGAALYFAMGLAKKETGDTVGAAGSLFKAATLMAKQSIGKRSINSLKNEK